jgi:hypothetical protein
MVRMTPRQQGDLGEFSAIDWLGPHGYDVSLPMGHSPDYDVIADDGERLFRVQVKTSTCYRNRRWEVTLCTRGGNQSWNGLIKRFSASRCDSLFVLVADGRRWGSSRRLRLVAARGSCSAGQSTLISRSSGGTRWRRT